MRSGMNRLKVFRTISPLDPKESGARTVQWLQERKRRPSRIPRWRRLRHVRLEIQSWRWSGVPFLIGAGKCLPVTTTEVLVKLRKPPLDILGDDPTNLFRFRLGPGEISLSLSARRETSRRRTRLPSLRIFRWSRTTTADEVDAYERLLGDAMQGDGMLFVREDAVEAAWAIVDPILGNTAPLPDTNRAPGDLVRRCRLAQDVGGWHDPEGSEANEVAAPRAA